MKKKQIIKTVIIVAFSLMFPWIFSLNSGNISKGKVYDIVDSGYKIKTGKDSFMDMEKFVAMAIMKQLDIDEPMEAVKVQAVVVRTYIYGIIKQSGGKTAHIEKINLPYVTVNELEDIWGDRFEEKYNKLMTAINETKGMIITCDGKIIKPYFHLSSSGKTRNGEEALGDINDEDLTYLRTVDSSVDMEADSYLAVKTVEKNIFAKKIRENFKDISISDENPLETFQIISRCQAGYVKTLQIGGMEITGDQFQKIFDLNSPDFMVEDFDGKVRITTLGAGHGLGLSMYGAKRMADSGKSCEDIIKYYYTGIKIEKIKN